MTLRGQGDTGVSPIEARMRKVSFLGEREWRFTAAPAGRESVWARLLRAGRLHEARASHACLSSPQGTLIQHLKEHVLHGNMTSSDIILYYSTVSKTTRAALCREGCPSPASFGAARLQAFLTCWPLLSYLLTSRSTGDPRLPP